jgi:hypothetical protein
VFIYGGVLAMKLKELKVGDCFHYKSPVGDIAPRTITEAFTTNGFVKYSALGGHDYSFGDGSRWHLMEVTVIEETE